MNTWTALLLGLVPIVAADAFFPAVHAEVAVATACSSSTVWALSWTRGADDLTLRRRRRHAVGVAHDVSG